MKFSAATIIAFAVMANAVALPANVIGGPDGPDEDVAITSTNPNAVVLASVETHFTGTFTGAGVLAPGQEPVPASQGEQKRAAIAIMVGAVALKGAGLLTKFAIEIAAEFISDLGQWNKARETFTQTTTLEMWKRNPDYNRYPAVVCYNKGYHLRNANGHTGRVKAKLSIGNFLKTDYDCMYMTGNNAFYTWSEGGYINLSYRYNGNRCSFNKANGDLTCR
ncbi:hypothetical protein MFRU_001g03900 [Monilinia fructicola]|uniref:DUF7888 domain-containing protein n=1 Tax=Monilinia fructicola TaxID=38448 RepID=A0A5M9K477_MONFR|nr:hypothetical protein EYC84_005228 [Monilinia fructicola]KAG4035621.1 hypothetical protein MFRU_001g03900 [Monilinia fructicola]